MIHIFKRRVKYLTWEMMMLLILTSCWNDKHFCVEGSNIIIDVEKKGMDKFRVFIYEDKRDKGMDYIDLDYDMSDMPTIQLCIPADERNKIFIIDRRHDVEQIYASKFDLVLLSPEKVKNGELISSEKMERLDRTLAKIDSVKDSIPSVTIQLNSRLSDLFVWKTGGYKDKRIVYPINVKGK